jgi:hypothetical protein
MDLKRVDKLLEDYKEELEAITAQLMRMKEIIYQKFIAEEKPEQSPLKSKIELKKVESKMEIKI